MSEIKIKPSQFAENFLYIEPGKPFSIRNYPAFYPIYNSPSDSLMLRCSRQVGKSLTIAMLNLINIAEAEMMLEWSKGQGFSRDQLIDMCQYPFHALYVAPSNNHVSYFSKQKLTLILDGSPIMKNFITTSCSDQISYKSFKNGSDFILKSCFHSPDRIRGISCDSISIDELQDLITDHIPVIQETQTRSLKKKNIKSGTPKTTRNGMEYYWKRSTQNEWAVPCRVCGNWNILGEDNIGIGGTVCSRSTCKRTIYPIDGRWVSMNPKEYTEGFRIHAMMYAGQPNFIPWTGDRGTKNWEESLMYKYENYSRQKFYNEVLGLPYDSGSVPITEQEIMQACDTAERQRVGIEPGMHPGLTHAIRDKVIVAGVDWGTSQEGASATVLTIVAWVQDRFHLLFAKKYSPIESDPNFQVDDILKWANHYGCMAIGVDWGFGHMQNHTLASKYGTIFRGNKSDRVVVFYNSHGLGQRRKWDDKSMKYVVNRTDILTDLFLAIKSKKIIFPDWNVFKPFSEDLLNIYQEYNEDTGIMKYDHQVGDADDFVFSLAYAIEAALIHIGKPCI